ncbi:MAG TPA: hypothetical protein VFS54_01300 [Solirubrobacterales bacterium]|nr:hypothetical protein [Solirubrobacterales bacterium]
MKLGISISYEIETDPGEDQETNEAVVDEVVKAKASEFAVSIKEQLELQGVANIRMSIDG